MVFVKNGWGRRSAQRIEDAPKRRRIVDASRGKIDVLNRAQGARDLASLVEHGNDRLIFVYRDLQLTPHLLRCKHRGREHDKDLGAGVKGMVNRLVPVLAGLDVPLIEPHRNSLIAETRDQLEDEILVLTRIRNEHMAGHNQFHPQGHMFRLCHSRRDIRSALSHPSTGDELAMVSSFLGG